MLLNKRKALVLSIAAALSVTLLFAAFSAQAEANEVSREVLRFHIVANSDSAEDQRLKLLVRDEIVLLADKLFANAQNKDQAISICQSHFEEIHAAARKVLSEEGCDDSVEISVKRLYFPTKRYENVVFPAGNYDAVQIRIGEGAGQNFWCVMYPALCIPSATGENKQLLSKALDQGAIKLVTHPYTLRFKLAEWFGFLKKFFS